MNKISLKDINKLFSAISKENLLYAPIKSGDQAEFKIWSAEKELAYNTLKTVKSAKDIFFPQTENMVSFKTEGQKISVIEDRNPGESTVIFGVRGCDAKSFTILDNVFLAEPVDTYYKTRRENTTIITLACSEPEENCFCHTFGIDATAPAGGDIVTWIVDGDLYLKPETEKGTKLFDTIKDLLSDADEEKVEASKNKTKKIMEKLPFANLSVDAFKPEKLNEFFNSPKWKDLSASCLGCGACTFVCPTCQCFDIRDFDTGHGIKRFRCWDSCMYSDFTKMAAANPRLTQLERFRQRFMHKLVYYPANNNGMYSCVGCGRCVAKCPISMNIVKVIKALGEDNNE